MAKRRTKKQKQNAKHSFTINWEPGSSNLKFEPSVNSQINNSEISEANESRLNKNATFTVKGLDLVNIKKNIFRSLILAGLILASEVVLYLIWK